MLINENATHFSLIFPGVFIVSFDRCGFWEKHNPISDFGSIQCGTALQNDCTEQDTTQKGENLAMSH